MENWKERFEYIYVIEENKGEKYLRKYDHTTIVESLEHFISEELDKVREEGFEQGYKEAKFDCEMGKEFSKESFKEVVSSVLSKLETKEDGK